jgi:hypothetical protein
MRRSLAAAVAVVVLTMGLTVGAATGSTRTAANGSSPANRSAEQPHVLSRGTA